MAVRRFGRDLFKTKCEENVEVEKPPPPNSNIWTVDDIELVPTHLQLKEGEESKGNKSGSNEHHLRISSKKTSSRPRGRNNENVHYLESDESGKQDSSSRSPSNSPGDRSKSNQRWMKLRTTVQLSGAISSTIQKKATLKREDSFLKRFSTRQVPEAQETFETCDDDEGGGGTGGGQAKIRRKKKRSLPRSVVNPDGNFYFYWLFLLTFCVLYNLWSLIVRESFPELQVEYHSYWLSTDALTDFIILLDVAVQFRTGYLEQGLMVYKTKKLAKHYVGSKNFWLDILSLLPSDLIQIWIGTHPMVRVPRFLKVYRMYKYYYMVESRTVYPNVWRVVNLIHILLLLAHWFGCFYYLISEAEGFVGPWVYPDPNNPTNSKFAPLTRKYLGSLYWSTLTLTTIGDLPTPYSNWQYLFTIVSYLIGVFIFATIVGQVGNVITNRNANRLEFERLLDGAKMYMRHHRVPRDMQRRVLRWYDYSWSRGRIQGGGDINTALGLLPDKLKTELALHVNLSVLKKVTIFQECQPEFLHDLVLKMKAYIFTPGDLICRKGEVAREMFIIADGILEVISEQGKVLTTMQAGDFFGEIGILNLDGLNKRTADVRSVGYSELLSLSREDVLAAMKDYPEAQEILQSLGRKRLMEARKANAPPKKTEKKGALSLLGQSFRKGSDDGSDTAGKRIVDKLRSDVKGLKNAIRKSRKSNSSKDDSSEAEGEIPKPGSKMSTISVQHYTAGSGHSVVRNFGASKTQKSRLLKRMHHVTLSDETESVSPIISTSLFPKNPLNSKSDPSPISLCAKNSGQLVNKPIIGAGLPLIQRLRLLRQQEEKERVRLETDDERKGLLNKNLILRRKNKLQTIASVESPKKNTETKEEENANKLNYEELPQKRPSSFALQNKDFKNYGSVDDLSPEYSRLPFIKKLKILNERQKISDLVTVKGSNISILTRSISEGSSEIPTDFENLYNLPMSTRSTSSLSQFKRQPNFPLPLPSPDSSPEKDIEPIRSSRKKYKNKVGPVEKLESIESPESNETAERRHLKSILKTFDEENGKDFEERMSDVSREPTVEGYAARHKKFVKNVTFHRQALAHLLSPEGLLKSDDKSSPESHISPKNKEPDGGPCLALPVTKPEDPSPLLLAQLKESLYLKMDEFESEFSSRFTSLEHDIKMRDDLISVLTQRVRELENKTSTSLSSDRINKFLASDDWTSSRTHYFSRDNSGDTVVNNSEYFCDEEGGDDEVFVPHGEASGWTVAEKESVEQSPSLWQLEFHREAKNRDNGEQKPSDAVTVDIGNSSTEYESTSSSDDNKSHSTTISKTLPLDSSSDENEDGLESSNSEDETLLPSKNWEAQMLASELHKKEIEKRNSLEILELDKEIQEMRAVVSSGALSPSELDKLESILDSKTKKFCFDLNNDEEAEKNDNRRASLQIEQKSDKEAEENKNKTKRQMSLCETSSTGSNKSILRRFSLLRALSSFIPEKSNEEMSQNNKKDDLSPSKNLADSISQGESKIFTIPSRSNLDIEPDRTPPTESTHFPPSEIKTSSGESEPLLKK